MWYYLFLGLRRQRSRSFLVSVGGILTTCVLILLSATTQTTTLRANSIVGHNWRSTYDLVVIPPSAHSLAGKSIPVDQLVGYDGGINLQQYTKIKHIPGIAVAAPIAFISYVSFPLTFVSFGSLPLSPGFYHLDWKLSAFNGVKQITEYHTNINIYGSATPCPAICALEAKQQQMLNDNGISDYFFARNGKGNTYLQSYLTGVPDQGEFLLAGIDPDAENQLVHLNKSITSGKPLSQQLVSVNTQYPHLDGSAPLEVVPNYDVPMLINTYSNAQLTLHATFTQLLTNTDDIQQVAQRGGSTYLNKLPHRIIFSGNVPIAQNNHDIFSQGANLIQQGNNLVVNKLGSPSFGLVFTSKPSSLTYQKVVSSPRGKDENAYQLVPESTQVSSGNQQSEVAFRNQSPLPGDLEPMKIGIGNNSYFQATQYTVYNGAAYTAQPVGQFNGSLLNAEFNNALNWLPENTYTSPPTLLRYNAQGQPTKSTALLPTTNSVSYLTQNPFALTTLAAAQKIRGNNCISVIRVRVMGDVTADITGWQRVAQIAQQIHKETGLQAIVTLGSSPSPTFVYIPGIHSGNYGISQTIEPIGWVEERWISLGVGIVYLNQSRQTQNLLLSTILLVCFGYLTVTLGSLLTSQRRETAILSAIGWRSRETSKLFISHALILILSGGLVGIGIALLLIALIGASPPWQIVVEALPILLALALVSALYPLWQLGRIRPAEVLRAGSTISSEHKERGWFARIVSRLPVLSSFAVRNLTRSRVRSLIALSSLFLSALLLTVMVDGLLAFRETLQGTLLGNYVLLQTAIPQLAGAAFAVLLTFLSVADLLLLQVRERQREIGLLQATGWRLGMVQRMFVQEGLTLAVVGTIPGVLVALGILLARHTTQSIVPVPIVGLGAVLLMMLVSGVATLPALGATTRMHLVDVLRTE